MLPEAWPSPAPTAWAGLWEGLSQSKLGTGPTYWVRQSAGFQATLYLLGLQIQPTPQGASPAEVPMERQAWRTCRGVQVSLHMWRSLQNML